MNERPEIESAPRRSFVARLHYSLSILLVLAAIAYVGLIIAGRTAGFRSMVEDRLKSRLGMPVLLASARISPTLNLVLSGIRTAQDDFRPVFFKADRLVLGWSLSEKLRGGPFWNHFLARGLELYITVDNDDQKLPPFWSALADQWRGRASEASSGAEAPRNRPAELWRRVRLDLEGSFEFASAEESASARGHIFVTPVEVPGRRFLHILLKAPEACRNDQRYRDVVCEMLDLGDQRIVLQLRAEPAL